HPPLDGEGVALKERDGWGEYHYRRPRHSGESRNPAGASRAPKRLKQRRSFSARTRAGLDTGVRRYDACGEATPSVQTEFAVDEGKFGRSDQPPMRDPDAIERPFEID